MLRFVATVLVAAFASLALAQVPPEKSDATFQVNDPDLEFKLWASEELQWANPTAMDVDHLGRVWVCEAVNYRQILRKQPILRPEGDRILILEDSTGSGKADKLTVFAQGPYLQAPLGIAVLKDPVGPAYRVLVCQSPDILLFEDKDGDGKADGPPTKFLTGFKGIDHDHGVHGITVGPDGKLYFSVGDQGVKDLQSSDGTGRKWTTNDTDCRAGTIWRCDTDGKNLELIAHNFRNEYKPCVDSFGNVFVSDNDDDGNQQARICYVMQGGNYGYYPRGRGETHWHEEQPGVVPKVLRTYFGSPCGMCFYEGSLLPEQYRGAMLHVDAGPRHLRRYVAKPNGAGFDIDRTDVVTSSDNWFRPSDVVVAPDGSVFVCDWYDPGVGGHGMGDTTRGRIYRFAPKGHKPATPKVDLTTREGLYAAFGNPANAVRAMAATKVRAMSTEDAETLIRQSIERSEYPITRARAVAQAVHLEKTEKVAGTAIVVYRRELDERFKLLAMRVFAVALTRADRGELAKAVSTAGVDILGKEPSAALRREALLWLPTLDANAAKPMFNALVKLYDGKDRFYLAALGIAAGRDPERRAALLADFDALFPSWNEAVADLVWELRPPSVLPRLETLLADAKLPAGQRARIVDIIATSSDTGTAKLLKSLETEANAEVRERIVANFRLFLPGKWRALGGTPEMSAVIDRLTAKPETAAAGLALLAAAERGDGVAKVKALFDAKPAPALVAEAVRTLGAIPTAASSELLREMLEKNAALAPVVVQALGQHLDANQRGNPVATAALEALGRVVMGDASNSRSAAVAALAGTRAGTQWLLDRKGKLPLDMLPEVGRMVRNTPHQELRNKALIAYPPPGKLDPTKLSIPALAKRSGNAAHGKEILDASLKGELQCLKCHRVAGVGGEIGPDLSAIGLKASKENLIESLILPSKAIADQFINWTVVTKAGVSAAGLLVAETADSLTLRDPNGNDKRILKGDIETREKNPVSLMPDNLVNTLSEDDLVDLVEYLFALRAPVPPAGKGGP